MTALKEGLFSDEKGRPYDLAYFDSPRFAAVSEQAKEKAREMILGMIRTRLKDPQLNIGAAAKLMRTYLERYEQLAKTGGVSKEFVQNILALDAAPLNAGFDSTGVCKDVGRWNDLIGARHEYLRENYLASMLAATWNNAQVYKLKDFTTMRSVGKQAYDHAANARALQDKISTMGWCKE